jgi:hypothetical protein
MDDAETAMRKQMYLAAFNVICQSLNNRGMQAADVRNDFLADLEQTITAALIEARLAPRLEKQP